MNLPTETEYQQMWKLVEEMGEEMLDGERPPVSRLKRYGIAAYPLLRALRKDPAFLALIYPPVEEATT